MGNDDTMGYTGDQRPPSVEDDPHALVGRTLNDRFRIDGHIGSGAFGAVYRGWQLSVDRQVAVKVLRKEALAHPTAIQRFFLEAKATSRLTHAHSVVVHDFGQTDDGLVFIAMEHLTGRTLREKLVKEGPLPVLEALRIVGEMASSLSEAHSLGIVHRDLKPENVFLTERPGHADFVKVIDFGIARARELAGDISLTGTGHIVGTPSYMAPETVVGKPVDARADVYAMGIMLFEMITGELPLKGATAYLIMRAHQATKPPTLQDVVPEMSVPSMLSDLVACCLAKDPKHRPRDATVMLLELEAARNSLNASTRATTDQIGHLTTGHALAQKPVRRTRVNGGVLGHGPWRSALAVLAAGGLLASGWLWSGGAADGPAVQAPAIDSPSHTLTDGEPAAAAAEAAENATAEGDATPSSPQVAPAVAPIVEEAPLPPEEVYEPDPPATVALRVGSVPLGAQVYRDGQRIGVTPFTLEVPRSDDQAVRLLLKAAGYRDLGVDVTPSGDREVSHVLERLPAEPSAVTPVKERTPTKKMKKRSKPSTKKKPPTKTKKTKIDALLD